MPVRTFDFCALQYLNQWLEKERQLCCKLASVSPQTQHEALIEAGGYFRIARNLPIKYEQEKGLARYQPIIKILDEIEGITPDNVNRVVLKTEREISAQYGGRKVLSLTTKFLWLKVKSPVRIYDSQARIALRTPEGDFVAYSDAFSAFLAQHATEIEQSCKKLKSVISYSVNPKMSPSEVDELSSKQWFKERVLDIYLWNQGNTP